MKKNFVLDTCVLVHNPESLFSFEDNDVYIPFVVLEELDNLKKREGETGRNARHCARHLDEIRKLGSLNAGVQLDTGGKIQVINKYSGPGMPSLEMDKNDNKILSTACVLQSLRPDEETVLVTNDVALRVKADAAGMRAEFFGKKKNKEFYSGVKEVEIGAEAFEEFKRNGWTGASKEAMAEMDIYPNQYLILYKEQKGGKQALARYNAKADRVVKLIEARGVFGIHPKSDEQRFAVDALLNEDVKLVSLIGKAGTGKTLLAVAAGLEKIINEDVYSKLLISRPIQPMGKDLGYLPGDIDEKMAPWMQPIHDNLEFLFDLHKRHTPAKKGKKGGPVPEAPLQERLFEEGVLQVEALTYIRGRSIPQQYMIVDEAQNLSPHEIKTIITRAGEGTKIILTGDTQQIDSPYLDEESNGLAYCVERMKHLPLHAHITLVQGERSELAEEGSKYL